MNSIQRQCALGWTTASALLYKAARQPDLSQDERSKFRHTVMEMAANTREGRCIGELECRKMPKFALQNLAPGGNDLSIRHIIKL